MRQIERCGDPNRAGFVSGLALAITLTANEKEKTYGDQLALDDTAFTTLDKDGDAVLPNGEVVTNVSINSATGVGASTTSPVATYADEIVISGPVAGTDGSGDGFLESNYDITYISGDLVIKPYQIIKVEILKDNLNAVYLRGRFQPGSARVSC